MPKPSISLRGIALRIESRGENFRSIFILSPEVGSIHSLQRISVRKNPTSRIDLFDEGDFLLQTESDPHSGFISDFELKKRRTELSHSYAAFRAASEFARILSLNAAHTENQEEVFSLVRRGLNAWESGIAPQATLFKCLYLYCRNEGYPIKEEWIARLSPQSHEAATQIISQPLADIKVEPSRIDDSLHQLLAYFRHQTHIRV